MLPHLTVATEQIEQFCHRWKVRSLAAFGSIIRDDFGPDSDVDVLVAFTEDADWGLWDLTAAETELANLLGRRVDLVERRAIEQSENWIRRRSILNSARTFYGG